MHKKKINVCKDFVGPSEKKKQLEGLGVYARIILRWILEKQDGCGTYEWGRSRVLWQR